MTDITNGDTLEYHIRRAEIFLRRGKTKHAITEAKIALALAEKSETQTAIKTFIAKCLSHLGKHEESNRAYRELINTGAYIPPIIVGILHNNLTLSKDDKAGKNIHLIKLFDIIS